MLPPAYPISTTNWETSAAQAEIKIFFKRAIKCLRGSIDTEPLPEARIKIEINQNTSATTTPALMREFVAASKSEVQSAATDVASKATRAKVRNFIKENKFQ